MNLLQRLSLRQYLMLAFLLIAMLPAAVALRGLLGLEQLLSQSREGAAQAATLSADVQQLAERSLSMERAARQYLVLGDGALRQRFETAAGDADLLLERLGASLPASGTIAEWRHQAGTARRQLEGRAAREARERALGSAFRRIDSLNAALAGQVRHALRQRNERLLAELDEGRRQLVQQMLAVVALALGLALLLGYWFGRPLKRLARAIDGLGENRFDEKIVIPGAADMRALGRRLDWLRLRLAELDADKARFLRHVSHELKTPLAALREGVALLEDGVIGELGPQQREVVGILRQHSQVLQGQIESLLHFNTAAFEARRLSRRRCDLAELARQVAESQRLQWQARGLQVSIEGGSLHAEVDAEKFAAVLGNLLANAIRFSPAQGRIHLLLSRLPRGLAIDISDEGPGVAPADRELIFEPFYRGERQMPDSLRSSGIGLSIVREYVAAHGGHVALLPSAAGAHFRIELPHADE